MDCIPVTAYKAKGDGTTDDSTAFQNAMNDLAGTGWSLSIPAKSTPYVFANPTTVPSNLRIIGSPGAVLKSTMAYTGNQTNSIFYATWVPASGAPHGTITANVTVGINWVIDVTPSGGTRAPAVGDYIEFSHNNSAQHFLVTAVSGTGPYTVTLDDVVSFPFVSGDAYSIIKSVPSNIHINGNGLMFTGTGDRAIELVCAENCIVSDCHYSALGGTGLSDGGMSFDDGGRDNLFFKCTVDGSGYGAARFTAIALEAQIRSRIIACTTTMMPAEGIVVTDGYGCSIVSSYATTDKNSGGDSGCFAIGSDGTTGLGSFDCSIIDCTGNNGRFGLVVDGMARLSVSGCRFNNNSVNGVQLANADGATTGISLTNVIARGGPDYGSTCIGLNIANSGIDCTLSGKCDFASTNSAAYSIASGSYVLHQDSPPMTVDTTSTSGTIALVHVGSQSTMLKLGAQTLGVGGLTYTLPAGLAGIITVDASGVVFGGKTLSVGPAGGTQAPITAQGKHVIHSDGTTATIIV